MRRPASAGPDEASSPEARLAAGQPAAAACAVIAAVLARTGLQVVSSGAVTRGGRVATRQAGVRALRPRHGRPLCATAAPPSTHVLSLQTACARRAWRRQTRKRSGKRGRGRQAAARISQGCARPPRKAAQRSGDRTGCHAHPDRRWSATAAAPWWPRPASKARQSLRAAARRTAHQALRSAAAARGWHAPVGAPCSVVEKMACAAWKQPESAASAVPRRRARGAAVRGIAPPLGRAAAPLAAPVALLRPTRCFACQLSVGREGPRIYPSRAWRRFRDRLAGCAPRTPRRSQKGLRHFHVIDVCVSERAAISHPPLAPTPVRNQPAACAMQAGAARRIAASNTSGVA